MAINRYGNKNSIVKHFVDTNHFPDFALARSTKVETHYRARINLEALFITAHKPDIINHLNTVRPITD